MTAMRLRMDDRVVVRVQYLDGTPYGSALTGLCDALVARTCAHACAAAGDPTTPGYGDRSSAALASCFGTAALGQLRSSGTSLRAECLYPDPSAVRPVALWVGRDGRDATSRRLALDGRAWLEVADWLSLWRELSAPPRSACGRALWQALVEVGGLTDTPRPRTIGEDGLTFVGHATAMWRAANTTLLVDPFMLGATRGERPGYRARRRHEVDADAILVTHSHPDHFDVGTLLALGRERHVIVPKVARESLLAVDMEARLRELGFQHVTAVSPGDVVRVGGLLVRVHTLFGEQPTADEVLHPEVRNVGCAYLVDGGSHRVLFVADAGRDWSGSAVDTLPRALEHGPRVDVVCGGYRGWRLYPAQYVHTSVARYLLFVPPARWNEQVRIMNDACDLATMSSRLGARWIVPYANGGAPWYWRHGLGPDLGGKAALAHSEFDPDESALHAVTEGAGAPIVVSLHPGEHARWRDDDAVERVVEPGFVWPFGDPYSEMRARIPTRGGRAS